MKSRSGKKDQYGRRIYKDEYGEYTTPTADSIAYYKEEDGKLSRKIRGLNASYNALENEKAKIQDRIDAAITRATQRARSPSNPRGLLGDGRDYNRLAPASRNRLNDIKIEQADILKRLRDVQTQRTNLLLNFQAERAAIEQGG